jgi:hypothetical protein
MNDQLKIPVPGVLIGNMDSSAMMGLTGTVTALSGVWFTLGKRDFAVSCPNTG